MNNYSPPASFWSTCMDGKRSYSGLKKLKDEHRKIKDKHGKTETGRSSWKFFDDIDKILGHKRATCPPTVIDTSDSADPTAPSTEGHVRGNYY